MLPNLSLFELDLIRKGLSPKTIHEILKAVDRLASNGAIGSRKEFDTFVVSLFRQGLSKAYINKYTQAIRHYCAFQGLAWGNDLPYYTEDEHIREAMSDEQVEAILEQHTSGFWTVFWSIAAYSGCRPLEIRKLTKRDCNLQNSTLIFRDTKTHKDRQVPISSRLLPLLMEYIKDKEEGYLFPNQSDPKRYITDTSYLNDFHLRCKRLGITGKKPYSFRHSFATRLLQDSDAPLFVVQDILGHTDPKITRRYYHGNINAMHKAVKRDPLVRKDLDPNDIVKQIEENIESFHLEEDKRFNYGTIKEAIGLLYKSIR